MIIADRQKYDADSLAWINDRIETTRQIISLGPRMMAKRRFNDDSYVIATMESMTPEDEFVKFPTVTLMKALEEAAKADYWYEREKDYGADALNDCREEGCNHGYDGK